MWLIAIERLASYGVFQLSIVNDDMDLEVYWRYKNKVYSCVIGYKAGLTLDEIMERIVWYIDSRRKG